MKLKLMFNIFLVTILAFLVTSCAALPETGAILDETGALILPTVDVFLAGLIRPLTASIVLVLLNFFLGVLAAVVNNTFEWNKVSGYLGKYFLLNILGWLVAEFLVSIIPAIYPDLPEWVDTGMVLVLRMSLFSSLLGSILKNGIVAFALWKTSFGQLLTRIGVPNETKPETS